MYLWHISNYLLENINQNMKMISFAPKYTALDEIRLCTNEVRSALGGITKLCCLPTSLTRLPN